MNKLSILFFVLLMVGCRDQRKFEGAESVSKFIRQNNIRDKTFILVVPLSSCQGCVDASLQFSQSNIVPIERIPSVLILITQNPSRKETDIRLSGYQLLHRKNVMVDYSNSFLDGLGILDGPHILSLEDGTPESFELISPDDILVKLDSIKKNVLATY